MSFHAPAHYMVAHPVLGIGEGNNGFFVFERDGIQFRCVASDGMGWEHVSVTLGNKNRIPTWNEMCLVKDLFWDKEDVVIQYHPAKSEYVNFHPRCLHLWKPIGVTLPAPDSILVGV